jgi:hypothetical protein
LDIDPKPRIEWDFNPPEMCAARHTVRAAKIEELKKKFKSTYNFIQKLRPIDSTGCSVVKGRLLFLGTIVGLWGKEKKALE